MRKVFGVNDDLFVGEIFESGCLEFFTKNMFTVGDPTIQLSRNSASKLIYHLRDAINDSYVRSAFNYKQLKIAFDTDYRVNERLLDDMFKIGSDGYFAFSACWHKLYELPMCAVCVSGRFRSIKLTLKDVVMLIASLSYTFSLVGLELENPDSAFLIKEVDGSFSMCIAENGALKYIDMGCAIVDIEDAKEFIFEMGYSVEKTITPDSAEFSAILPLV